MPVCYRHPDRESHVRCQRCGRPICPDCMHPASVGFQCPECVQEGARSTRSGRTAYGGRLARNPARTSQVLIGINLAVWLLVLLTGGIGSPWLRRLALLPDGRIPLADGTLLVPGVANGAVWQLVTSMFTHVQPLHIGFNMLALWFLGPQVEIAVGRLRFLALYLLSGLTGSAFVYWFSPEHSATLGASGAIFGLMGGLLVMAVKVRADVSQLLLWLGLNFLITVVGRGFISWQGHLGGFLGGLLVAGLLVYAPRRRRALWQGVGMIAMSAALVAGLAVRTLMLV